MLGLTGETAPHQVVLEAYGVTLRVCASTSEILARIEPYFPPGWRVADDPGAHRMGIVSGDDGGFIVYDEATPISKGASLESPLMELDTRMRMHIAVRAPSRIFIHAGVAAHRGRAIVIPGHSYAGKTTLVVALVRAGAAYYSDEFAVLDRDGLVHPYQKPPSLRGSEDLPQVEHEIDPLHRHTAPPPIPLGLAVFTRYREGGSWDPRRLAAGQAALAMIENAVQVRIRPAATVTAITNALQSAIALEGERGEAVEVAEALLRLTARAAP